jgi:serine/threonine protein kinase
MAASDKLLPKRYEVLRELGSGGTSVVYHARDRETGREVAVKVLVKERLEDRFSREAERLSQLSHPNLVGFLEVGKHAGHDFLVMEYLPGGDLGSHLRGKGSEEILGVFVAICAGLGYLHSRGIIHRDVKPANILIDAKGQPKLADLGSARQVDRQTRITKAGSILGTYAYLAPEQIQSLDAGPAADLYSLGVCLFEALTGRRPFTVKNEFKLMKAHLEEPPPSLHKFRPELPDSLEALVASLLEKKPEARPTTAQVVAGMLARSLDDLHSQDKRLLVDNDPELVIDQLSEAQRSVLLAMGYLGESATFAEICGASAFAEDRTDSLLESLVEAKLLTCPDQDTFLLTIPRKLVLSRITPRVRELFQSRLVASGQQPSSAGLTTAGLTTAGLTTAGFTSSGLLSGSGSTRTLTADRTPTPTPSDRRAPVGRGRRALQLGLILVLLAAASAGWAWSHSAELVVASFPEQASVIVDGQWRGKTPLRVRGLLPGTHAVRLVLDGYLTEVREVYANPMQPVPLDFTLTESRGRLALQNVPEDAQLTVDGAVYDPKELEDLSVLAGKTRIKVVKEGYRTYFQDVIVKAGEPTYLKVEMSPIQGYLELTSSPAGATVLLDGKEVGKTPLELKALPYGPHKLEMALPAHATHTQSVAVTDEAPDKVHVDLLPLWGHLAITSQPAGAEIFVASRSQGKTPLTLQNLPPGNIEVESKLAGHKETVDQVDIVAGQTLELTLNLVKGKGRVSGGSLAPGASPSPVSATASSSPSPAPSP